MIEQTSTTRPFTAAGHNAYLAEHKLMAVRCTSCSALYLPPRAVCPACHSEALEWVELSGNASLTGFTIIYVAPTAMLAQGYSRENPYISGIVELLEGPKISARITGLDPHHPEVIKIGITLKADYLEVGEGEGKRTFLAFKAAS